MNNIFELWAQVLDYIRKKINKTVYNVWFSEIEITSFDEGKVIVYFPSKFKMTTVQNQFDYLIHEAFEAVCGFDCTIDYTCPENAVTIPEQKITHKDLEQFKNDTLTFDNFISGPSNKFAFTAARAIAANPGGMMDTNSITNYNPLFIYGASGLGKTHLLHAISYEIAKNYPNLKVVYVSAEEFANEFITALGNRTTDDFHEKYRTNIDVLLVDDIQFIAGKTQTEEEFFHTFNSLVNNGKQVVLTSDRPPKEIHSLTDRLRSRFNSGLLADIQSPEFETRCAIIKRKALLLNFEMDDDVIDYIADKVKSNIRQLEGITKTMHAKCMYGNQKPTIALAQNSIKDIVNPEDIPLPVTIKKIVDEVSRTTGVSVEDIYSKKRTANIANARKMCFYIIRNVTDTPYEVIGKEFSKDHSTVMYNVQEFEKKLSTNSTLNSQVLDIINNIKEN